MLNISNSKVSIGEFINESSTFKTISKRKYTKVFLKIMIGSLLFLIVLMFLPWTQNISANGKLTTINPNERPQTINTVIAGKIEKWFVKDGDFVKKGDTIILITEIKDEYFDPKLLERTQQQIQAKENSVTGYMNKVKALDQQVDALNKGSVLKLQQGKNKLKQTRFKVISDSTDFINSKENYKIAVDQFDRFEKLYVEGLKSLTEVENRKNTMQKAYAAKISAENKLLSSRNEYINAEVELSSIQADYMDKVSKSESEKFASISNMYDAEAQVTKLQNQYSNYNVRTGYYLIKAPQDGYITKAFQTGIGQTIKEGTEIVSIMPSKYNLAVEMFINPIDLPLLQVGQKTRIQFDGWPAIVFSGWPNTSYGTFGGEVFGIDKFIGENQKYRVLIKPDVKDKPWPSALRVGSGARTMALLKNVSIWYETWRQANGFPPDYYIQLNKTQKKHEEKSN